MLPVLQHIRTMPVRSRRSRGAQKKRHQGGSGFTKRRASTPSPEPDRSVYSISDTNTNASTLDTVSGSERGRGNQAVALMEGLQRLYSVFLPPHLQPNETRRGKRQRVSKRSTVYTRDSKTTAWRRGVAQGKAAEGCTTLDTYVTVQRTRKVGGFSDRVRSDLKQHLVIDSDSAAPHHLTRKTQW
jgi:hypothetical protein